MRSYPDARIDTPTEAELAVASHGPAATAAARDFDLLAWTTDLDELESWFGRGEPMAGP